MLCRDVRQGCSKIILAFPLNIQYYFVVKQEPEVTDVTSGFFLKKHGFLGL